MHSFIVLTKKPNFQAMNSRTLLVNDKQLTYATTQKLTETLRLLGFKQITPRVLFGE